MLSAENQNPRSISEICSGGVFCYVRCFLCDDALIILDRLADGADLDCLAVEGAAAVPASAVFHMEGFEGLHVSRERPVMPLEVVVGNLEQSGAVEERGDVVAVFVGIAALVEHGISGKRNGFQPQAVRKGKRIDRLDALGDDKGLETGTALESLIADVFEGFRELDVGDRCAVQESIHADALDPGDGFLAHTAAFKPHVLQRRAFRKRIILDRFDTFGDDDGPQADAAFKNPPGEGLHTGGDIHGFKACAAGKRPGIELGDAVREVDAFEVGAAVEHISVEAFHAVGDQDGAQVLAAGKRTGTDELNAVGELNGFDVIHPLKSRIADHLDAVRDADLGFREAVAANQNAADHVKEGIGIGSRLRLSGRGLRDRLGVTFDCFIHNDRFAAEGADHCVLGIIHSKKTAAFVAFALYIHDAPPFRSLS